MRTGLTLRQLHLVVKRPFSRLLNDRRSMLPRRDQDFRIAKRYVDLRFVYFDV